MADQLHLLRPFARWRLRGESITTVDAAEEYVKHIASLGFERFYTAVGRAPTRAEELVGGSVYFVKHHTLFRMPFVCITDNPRLAARFQGKVLVEMKPELIRVAPRHIGFLRGWRYMEDKDAPRDIPASMAGKPAEFWEVVGDG